MSALTSGTTTYGVFHQLKEVNFHQPKMPPIPEDAVVIADYMLMADYVKNTSNGIRKISKGVRKCSGTRDVHHNSTAGGNFVTISQRWEFEQGFNQIYIGSNQAAGVIKHHLSAFGYQYSLFVEWSNQRYSTSPIPWLLTQHVMSCLP